MVLRARIGGFVFLVCLLSALFTGCHPIRPNTVGNKPATLIFGQGGGVTGKYMEYALLIDGTLYRVDTQSGERTFLRKLNKKDTRAFFVDAEMLNIMKMDFNHPYNINYYIVYQKGVYSKKVNWGDANDPPPEGIKELWDRLWKLSK